MKRNKNKRRTARRKRLKKEFETLTKQEDIKFIEHLEWASSVVRTWPEWRQNVLGGYAVAGNNNDLDHQRKLYFSGNKV